MNQLVERFFGLVTIHGTDTHEDGRVVGWGTFLESHPYKTYPEAIAYIEKHTDVEGFEYGSVEKKFITEKREKELLEKEEEVYKV